MVFYDWATGMIEVHVKTLTFIWLIWEWKVAFVISDLAFAMKIMYFSAFQKISVKFLKK